MDTGHRGNFEPDVEGADDPSASSKFYFQQRRGRIDLRSLSQLDLDRVVRDIDIDVLQAHLENLTFCELREEDLRYLTDPLIIKLFKMSQLTIEYLLYAQNQLATNLHELATKYMSKKKSLAKKRLELAALQESTKHLRDEVRTKKNSVATLETLLKSASRSHRRRRSKKDEKNNEADASDVSGEGVDVGDEEGGRSWSRPIVQPVVQFFVTGPNGLCVEFNEKRTATIVHLVNEVRKAFVSKQDIQRYTRRNGGAELGPAVKLICQGKILMEDTTIEGSNIRDGDAIVAVIDMDKDDLDSEDEDENEGESSERKESTRNVAGKGKKGQSQAHAAGSGEAEPVKTSDLAALLAAQQEAMRQMAEEMRRGLEVALKSAGGKENQNQLQSADIIPATEGEFMEKFARFESNMWSQFEDKMEEYKKTLDANKEKLKGSGLEIGELESDGEEVPVRSGRVAGQKRSGVDALGAQAFSRESIDGLRESIEALRQQIKDTAANAVTPQYIPVPVVAPPTVAFPSAAAPDDSAAVSPKAPASKQSKQTPAAAAAAPGIAEKSTKKKTKIVQKAVEPEEPVPAPASAAEVAAPAADAVAEVSPEVTTSDKSADVEQPVASEPVKEAVPDEPAVTVPEMTTTADVPVVAAETVAVESTDSGDDMVNVTFPFTLNPDLASNSSTSASSSSNTSVAPADNLIIPVQKDLAVDDLLLELRMVISHMVDVPLNRVSLILNGKTIVLGLDVPADVSLTARNAAKMAAAGELTAKILPAKTDQKKPLKAAITDAQVDALVHRWEDEQLMGRIPVPAAMKKSFTRDQGKGIVKKRDWDDDKDLVSEEGLLGEPDEAPWGSKEEVLLRRSLGSMLDDISDKEGLTDEEYEAKMKSLRKVVTKVPADVSQKLRESRSSLAEAIAAATVDSGSEDIYSDIDSRGGSVSISLAGTLREQHIEEIRLLKSTGGPSPTPMTMTRESIDTTSTAGMLRLSLPNGGKGRRSYESFEGVDVSKDGDGDRSDFKLYGMGSSGAIGRRFGYDDDEDAAPMMASLTSLPTPIAHNDSISGTDMRASMIRQSNSFGSPGPDNSMAERSNLDDSIDVRKTAKRIQFGADDENDASAAGARADSSFLGVAGPRAEQDEKHGGGGAGGGGSKKDSGKESTESLKAGPATGTATGAGAAGGKGLDTTVDTPTSLAVSDDSDIDFGNTIRTVSSLGASGKDENKFRKLDLAEGKVTAGKAAPQWAGAKKAASAAQNKDIEDSSRDNRDDSASQSYSAIDISEALDTSEGPSADPLSLSEVQRRADDYERKYSGIKDAVQDPDAVIPMSPAPKGKGGSVLSPLPASKRDDRSTARGGAGGGPGSSRTMDMSSPMSQNSKGSSINSGLFTNLADNDGEGGIDEGHSLALSESTDRA